MKQLQDRQWRRRRKIGAPLRVLLAIPLSAIMQTAVAAIHILLEAYMAHLDRGHHCCAKVVVCKATRGPTAGRNVLYTVSGDRMEGLSQHSVIPLDYVIRYR